MLLLDLLESIVKNEFVLIISKTEKKKGPLFVVLCVCGGGDADYNWRNRDMNHGRLLSHN